MPENIPSLEVFSLPIFSGSKIDMIDTELTPKQERFAQNIALKGMTQADAYRNAYNAENMTNECIWTEASGIMSRPKVARRVAQIRDSIIEKAIYTNAEWARQAEEIRCLALAQEKPDLNVALKAQEQKAQAAGIKEHKIDITSKGQEIVVNAEQIAARILGK